MKSPMSWHSMSEWVANSRVRPRLPKHLMALRLLATALLLACAATSVRAQDGAYVVEPGGGRYFDVKIQPDDQKIVAAGWVGSLPGTTTVARFGVARYDSFGVADVTYGNGGVANPVLGVPLGSFALSLQPDGKAVVAGDVVVDHALGLGVVRLNVDGSPDVGFGSGGWSGIDVQPGAERAYAVGLQSSGKIVAAGYSDSSFDYLTNTESALVARFTAGGAIDSGTGGFGQLKAKKPAGYTLTSYGVKYNSYRGLAVQPDDKLVVAGTGPGLVVARYTAAGTPDSTFNGRGYALFSAAGISESSGAGVALQADGKVVVVGSCSGVDGSNDMLIARFKPNGSRDTSFSGGSGYVRLDIDGTSSMTTETARGVAVQPDGKLIVVGDSRPWATGIGVVMAVRLNANGSPDPTFGAGGLKIGSPLAGTGYHNFEGNAVALQSDGTVIVAGTDYWGTTGDTHHPLLMRFNP